MADLTWFDGYSGQTTEELLALEGKYRTDSLVVAFEDAIQRRESEGLTGEEATVLAIEALEREVNNGGYSQFFLNSSCAYAPIVVNGLRQIGCSEAAALTQKAIDALGVRGELTAEAIEAVMVTENEERDTAFAECDARYFERVGDLSAPLLEYIKKHRDRIRLT